jgi:calcium-dependent protein kinase
VHKRYKLLQKIGEGGFGVVHKAVCLSSLEERAIKVIALKNYSCLQKKLILNEVAMLLKIDHPNIIKVYEVIEFELTFYIVTEYCDAGSLCDYLLKHKKPGEQFARNVMQKLLSAVRYLHSKCIIHRDIKLDNIVVKTARGEEEEVIIKVIDFGLSIQSFSPVAKGDKVIGTPQYIAPESIMGMYSFKSDIWSCGVILYMLLSGQSPFKAPLKGKVFERIKKEEINLQGICPST